MKCTRYDCDNEVSFQIISQIIATTLTATPHADGELIKTEPVPYAVRCLVCGYEATPKEMGMDELEPEPDESGKPDAERVMDYLESQNVRMRAELQRMGLNWIILDMQADTLQVPEVLPGGDREFPQVTVRLEEDTY